MAIKLGDALVHLGTKNDGLKKGLGQAEAETKSWAGRVSDGIGLALGAGVVGAIAGVGLAVAKAGAGMVSFSADSAQAVRNLQSELGATREEAEILGQVSKNVWASGVTDNVLDAAKAVGQVRSQLKSLNAEQIQQSTQASLAFQEAYGAPLEKTIDAQRVLMEDLGLTGQEALDFIAAGYQRGLDRGGDFLETVTEYGTQFKLAGADAGQFFSIMETGLAGGVLGTDKAADSFKEFQARILDGSVATQEGLAAIGLSQAELEAQINSGAMTITDAYQGVVDRLNATEDATIRTQAGTKLLGTQYEDLGAAAQNIDAAAVAMEDLAGATEQTMIRYSGLGDMARQMGRRLQVALEPAVGVFLDMISQATPQIEGFFRQIEAGAAQFAAGFAAIMRSVVPLVGQIFRTIRGDSGKELEDTAQNAGQWGREIVLQLARGMASALTAVVQVINKIGQLLRTWFKPASPPKVAKDIDKWGIGLIESWFSGMQGAAVKGFNGLAGTVTGLFKRFGSEEDAGLFGKIMGGREALAQAFKDIEGMGSVSGGTMAQLQSALSSLPSHALDYVEAALQMEAANKRVEAAQERLNDVNEKYKDLLAPISAELQGIQDARANTADEKRIAQLQAAIARGRLSDEEKAAAQMEIRERQLRIQQRTLQAQHKEEQTAAQDELDAAQTAAEQMAEELELREALLAATEDQQDAIQAQKDLLDSLADTMGSLASAAEAIGEGLALGEDPLGLGGGLGLGEGPLGEDPLGLEGLMDDLDIEGLVSEIETIFAPLQEEIGGLETVWDGVGTAWASWWEGIKAPLTNLKGGVLGALWELWDIYWDDLIGKWEAFRLLFEGDFAGFLEAWTLNWIETRTRILEVLETLFIDYILPILAAVAQGFIDWVTETDWEAVATTINDRIEATLALLWGRLSAVLDQLWVDFKKWFTETDWEAVGFDLMTRFLNTIAMLWEGGQRMDSSMKAELIQFLLDVIKWFQEQDWESLATTVIDGIVQGIQNGMSAATSALTDLASGMWDAWVTWWETRSPSKKMADFMEGPVAGGVVQGADRASAALRQAGSDMAAATFGGFAGEAGGAAPAGGGIVFSGDIHLEDRTAVIAFFEYLTAGNSDLDMRRIAGAFTE